jgi:hypothetical protein
MAITSKQINLVQLDKELGSKGLVADFSDKKNQIIKPSDQSDVSEAQLETAIAAHIALAEPQPSVIEKLAAAGLTVDELKVALGL